MNSHLSHPSYAGRIGRQPDPVEAGQEVPSDSPVGYARILARADRACCCPASPAVVALIPPSPGRPHRTDLLFCMHHYRAARQSLAATGATVIDRSGAVLSEREAPETRTAAARAVAGELIEKGR